MKATRMKKYLIIGLLIAGNCMGMDTYGDDKQNILINDYIIWEQEKKEYEDRLYDEFINGPLFMLATPIVLAITQKSAAFCTQQ
jgi:hypothetical protein